MNCRCKTETKFKYNESLTDVEYKNNSIVTKALLMYDRVITDVLPNND